MSQPLSPASLSRTVIRTLVGASLLAATAASSVPALAQDTAGMVNRLSRLENEVQTLSQQVYRGGGGGGGGGSAGPAGAAVSGSVAADFEVRLTQLETAIRDIKGKSEEAAYAIAQLKDRLDKVVSDSDFRFQQLESAGTGAPPAAPPPAAPAKAKEPAKTGAVAEAGKADSGKVDGGKPAAATKPAAPPPTAQAGALGGGDAATQDEYEKAFALLRDANYEKAEQALTSFIKKHASHSLAGNAQYWLGETFYVRGKYTEAAVAFAEGYQKFPKNTKAPDNLLKLAKSLGQLKQQKDACLALGQLNTQFPEAPANVKRGAEAEGKKLGCK